MLAELVTVRTGDGIDLDGALYLPTNAARRQECILIVHGLTWNFYRGPSRWLPALLVEAGYGCLSLNMRDHDLQEPKDFDLAHRDLRAGIDYCFDRGASRLIIVAHGFGCNKVVCYPALSEDSRVRDYALTTLGSAARSRPDVWSMVLQHAPRLTGEVLIVQGSADPSLQGRTRADEFVAAATCARCDVVLLDGGNHYFDGRHTELSNCIINWLGRVLLTDGLGSVGL